MLFRKSLLGKLINILSINTLIFVSTSNIARAEKLANKLLIQSPETSSLLNHFRQPSFLAQIISSKVFTDLKIAQTNSVNDSQQVNVEENGSPSLRRSPTEGIKKFEPTRIPLIIPFNEQPYRASPSITIINPSGYGAAWGNAGIGFGYQERVRFVDADDGVIGLGFGLGNPQKNIGAQIGVSLVDVSAPFQDGALNLKLHRRLPQDFSVALGVQGLATWGETDGGSSLYGVVTKRFRLRQDRTKPFSEIYTSLGVGGGQFRSEFNINDGNDNVGIFSSLAIRAVEPVGLITEWTGQDLTIGISIVPFRRLPVVIVPALTDITGEAGDGTRFILGAGYTFSF